MDVIVSRFFLEHVPPEEKMPLLLELRRVLRPGGWLITLQDCECNNPLWRWARREPALFQTQFVEKDGHFGLLYASQNLELFRQAGLEVVRYQGSNKTPLVGLPMMQWMQPYRARSMPANVLLGLAAAIAGNRFFNALYTFGVTLWDDLVEQCLPLDHARYLLCACRLPDTRVP